MDFDHAFALVLMALGVSHGLAHGAALAADAYADWALANEDPGDDARALKIQERTRKVIHVLDWISTNLVTFGRGVRR